MTNAWAADIAAGHNTALLAWRRADVADLNRLARDHWARLGRLHGDDITVTGGRTYAVGDRIVALAPTPPPGSSPANNRPSPGSPSTVSTPVRTTGGRSP
jgi:hypothetical protein